MLADNRPTRAYIYLDRLIRNYRRVQRLAGDRQVLAVVKADAYGHGAPAVSYALQSAGCRWFGVATVNEAVELREAGITGEILLLGPVFPGDESEAVHYGITCTVYDEAVAQRLHAAARKFGRPIPVHLKVDTGMGRLGFDLNGFARFVRDLASLDGLAVRGLYTHLAEADQADPQRTEEQCALLRVAQQTLVRAMGDVAHLHVANSAALLTHKHVPGDMVRPGIMLYGAHPAGWLAAQDTDLEGVLEYRSEIVQVRRVLAGQKISYGGTWVAPRDGVIGVVAAGYADGVPRALSNVGEVVVGGRRVPICGRVCMDMFMVDLTDVELPALGQPVTLIGRAGTAAVSADDWAAWADTIPYEIFCNVSKRVPRVYEGAFIEGATG